MPLARTTTSPYEPVFARYAGNIPQAYLRTLAFKESSFKPDNVHPQSHATGLFQITATALQSFNNAKRSRLSLAHLTDPALNTQVAVHHLGSVVNAYRRVNSLKPDWSSRRWLELLTLGWNAGHNAVISLASKMEKAGLPPERITADTVSHLARATGRAKYVAEPGRVVWSKSVADMFLGGGAVPATGTVAAQPVMAAMFPGLPGSESSGGTVALVFGVIAAGLAVVFGRREDPYGTRTATISG